MYSYSYGLVPKYSDSVFQFTWWEQPGTNFVIIFGSRCAVVLSRRALVLSRRAVVLSRRAGRYR